MEKLKQTIKQEVLSAFRFRHATKEFDSSRKISDSDFEFILETGRLSPSSFGFEPWQFVVVQNKELRQKLIPYASGAQRQLPGASHFMLLLTRLPIDMVADSEYIRHMMEDVQQLPAEVVEGKGKVYDTFLKEKFRLQENERAMFEWACRQTYLALGNMMTSAALIGIDSCPIEGFDKVKIEEILASEGLLDPEHFGIACMAAFGYRLEEPRGKTRQLMGDVVKWV
ncbi:NAD(P)H-dependent oxidoreductase [Paenibacillus sp. sgz500958]|uniref:NAD(P)H-dependent oxidoreductase n=1 Tax=Paenibacillus sp. sgz500958 TaxID=3242475 RepID=UPI0036D38D0C